MTIKDINEKIMSDAQNKSEEIIFQAESKAREIIRKGKKNAENISEDILDKNRQEGLLKKNKILTEANLDAKKTILSEKQKIIDDVFNQALENILKSDDREYCQFIKKLILDNIEKGDETIFICGSDKNRITKDFINSINNELKTQGKKGALKLSSSYISIEGGVIIGSGNIRKNISLELLLQKVREEYETEISKKLFN
ncbi:MAG: V-type ATP synthase subunit E family protein [Candidatus Caldatribacteriota bacterium]|nr:V-type ATP synthase subunit E family protein [Candidatus Caldatribacteriota bacterium]